MGSAAAASIPFLGPFRQSGFSCSLPQVSHSITPVVRDGVWIWDEPPEGQQGYLDGREFDVSVGVRWKSAGSARNLAGATVAPVAFPEQEVTQFEIRKTDGCDAQVVSLTETAGQLQVTAPVIERGQTIEAAAVYRLKLYRVCPRYQADQFPAEQEVPRTIADMGLGNSPGIRSDLNAVKRIVDAISSRHDHPWETAKKFNTWVWENIRGMPGDYTSVRAAIENGVGDCEERAGVFIALCRAAGIPARLVWVPNHSWAEFCLLDHDGVPHWIPCHTAAYNWFGWTGAHEVVFQKGDRVKTPGKNETVRLINDWYSFQGRRPTIEFFGSLTPVATGDDDPGPGKRKKDGRGAWDLVGDHPADKTIRS